MTREPPGGILAPEEETMKAATGGSRLRTLEVAAGLLLILGNIGCICRPASGQAVAAGSKSVAVDVFGGVTELKLDYGGDYNKYSTGFVVGGDYIRVFPHFDVQLEPRFGRTSAHTNDDTQTYFLADLVVSKAFGRLHPYVLGGIGYGKIMYSQGFGQDDSIVYTVGPGVQVDLTTHFAVKADWQYQRWNVGAETHGFNPEGVSVAVVYKVHFRR